jgi:hypothetical protein
MVVDVIHTGNSERVQKEEHQKDSTILDIFRNAAIAKTIMASWINYMYIGKFNREWKIVNVL